MNSQQLPNTVSTCKSDTCQQDKTNQTNIVADQAEQTDAESQQQQPHVPIHKASQSPLPNTTNKDRDCFEDIELYLVQLNKQIPCTHQTSDKQYYSRPTFDIALDNYLDKNLEAALDLIYPTEASSSSNKDHSPIKYPEFDTEIFNPFRKQSHNLKTRQKVREIMKHDHRRDASADGFSSPSSDSGRNTAKNALDYKKSYLFIYNLVLFVTFLTVFLILTIKLISGTIDEDTVIGAAFIIKILTYTQLLESIHPMLGLVPGGFMMPLFQVLGRLVVNHFLTEPAIRIDAAPYAHILFIVWSSIEIFRYSFYALRVFKVDVYPLTWCRYTLFIPLYPMGGFCESQVILSTIKHYGKTGTYSIGLPNAANFSFDLPMFLKFYVTMLGPSIYYLMRYMWSQRCKQLKREKLA